MMVLLWTDEPVVTVKKRLSSLPFVVVSTDIEYSVAIAVVVSISVVHRPISSEEQGLLHCYCFDV